MGKPCERDFLARWRKNKEVTLANGWWESREGQVRSQRELEVSSCRRGVTVVHEGESEASKGGGTEEKRDVEYIFSQRICKWIRHEVRMVLRTLAWLADWLVVLLFIWEKVNEVVESLARLVKWNREHANTHSIKLNERCHRWNRVWKCWNKHFSSSTFLC